MSLSMKGFHQRKLLGEFEEKHKLAQLCSSNLIWTVMTLALKAGK